MRRWSCVGAVWGDGGPDTARARGGRALFAKLPTGTSEEEKEARDRLFQQFDPNGNGFLSLAEIDKGIQDVLGLEVAGARGGFWGECDEGC